MPDSAGRMLPSRKWLSAPLSAVLGACALIIGIGTLGGWALAGIAGDVPGSMVMNAVSLSAVGVGLAWLGANGLTEAR